MRPLSLRQCIAVGGLLAAAYMPVYVLVAVLAVPLLWDVLIRLFWMSVIIAIMALVGVGALVEIAVGWVISLI